MTSAQVKPFLRFAMLEGMQGECKIVCDRYHLQIERQAISVAEGSPGTLIYTRKDLFLSPPRGRGLPPTSYLPSLHKSVNTNTLSRAKALRGSDIHFTLPRSIKIFYHITILALPKTEKNFRGDTFDPREEIRYAALNKPESIHSPTRTGST